MKEVTAKLKRLDITPRKTRAVVDLIRGMQVASAEAELMFRKERAAGPILKLLRSCIANARNQNLDVDKLVVSRIEVGKGPRMKRWLPRARGMATPLHKDFSHITLVLSEKEGVKARFTIAPKIRVSKETSAPKKNMRKAAPKKSKTEGEAKVKPSKAEKVKAPIKKTVRKTSV